MALRMALHLALHLAEIAQAVSPGAHPAEGKGAGLVLPRCTTEGMALHLAEIAQAVSPGAHAAVLLDRAGWHVSTKLVVPDNVTLVPLPPRSPELNPVENVWQFLREIGRAHV